MRNIKKSCYQQKKSEAKHKMGMSVMKPFLKIFDTFHYMNNVINVANASPTEFWSLQNNYNPIATLFLMCKIKDKNHQKILLDIIYTHASKRVGDKDFDSRANEILILMRNKITQLAKNKAIV